MALDFVSRLAAGLRRRRVTARWLGVRLVVAALIAPQAQASAGDSNVSWANMQGEHVSRSRASWFAGWLSAWPDVVFLGRFESWAPDPAPYGSKAIITCRI